MRTIQRIVNAIVYTGMGIFALYCAICLRYVPNPSRLTVLAVFVAGIVLIAFGARALFPVKLKA